MSTTSWVLTGLFAAGGAVSLSQGSPDDVESIGDALQLALPATAYAMTWIGSDGRGAGQYSLQLGTGMAATYGLKHLVSKRTPTAADYDSFPSAHTQAAFSGASFIHRRFGPRWGVPAYVLATYTGLSRVKAQRHYLDDVIAGMSIALVSGWTFVHPIDERVRLNPLLSSRGIGVELTLSTGKTTDPAGPQKMTTEPKWRYTWEVGRITVEHNVAQAPHGNGDEIDFRFRQRNNPMVTSNLQIDRRVGRRHTLTGRLAPFEVREEEHYDHPITFGGVTFTPAILDTRYLGYDVRARWSYRVTGNGLFRFTAGAGIEALATRAEIEVQQPLPGGTAAIGSGRHLHLFPVAHLHLGLAPGRWLFFVDADGSAGGSERYLDVGLGLKVTLTSRWQLGFIYRKVEWSLDSPELSNHLESVTPTISIDYSWP